MDEKSAGRTVFFAGNITKIFSLVCEKTAEGK